MRTAAVVLLCSLPLGGGCMRDADSKADAGTQSARELALFESVVQWAAREREHTAVALAAGPDRLSWGAAVAAPTSAEAQALALSRCKTRARLSSIAAPCSLYALDGRRLYLERK